MGSSVSRGSFPSRGLKGQLCKCIGVVSRLDGWVSGFIDGRKREQTGKKV